MQKTSANGRISTVNFVKKLMITLKKMENTVNERNVPFLPLKVMANKNLLKNSVKDFENSKPVFDPDFHTELIIKDEYEDCNLGNMEAYIIIE